MTYNKDDQGFTDEAIRAVEQELTSLAEKIGVTEMELGERIADATFRETYDFIEVELAVMKSTAIDIIHDRAKKRNAQVGYNQTVEKVLLFVGALYAIVAGVFLVGTIYQGGALKFSVPAITFIALFTMLILASANQHGINDWLLRETKIDIALSREINDSAKELLDNARA